MFLKSAKCEGVIAVPLNETLVGRPRPPTVGRIIAAQLRSHVNRGAFPTALGGNALSSVARGGQEFGGYKVPYSHPPPKR